MDTTQCVYCSKTVAVKSNGKLANHGFHIVRGQAKAPCLASGATTGPGLRSEIHDRVTLLAATLQAVADSPTSSRRQARHAMNAMRAAILKLKGIQS